MKKGKEKQSRHKEGVNYEKAMDRALSEIFHNLELIKEETRKQTGEVDVRQQKRKVSAPAATQRETKTSSPLESRRKISAPAGTVREATTTSEQMQSRNELRTKPCTLPPVSTLPVIYWDLHCFDEDEQLETVGVLGNTKEM